MVEQKVYSALFCICAIALMVVAVFTGIQITQPLTLLFAWRTMMYAHGLWDKYGDK